MGQCRPMTDLLAHAHALKATVAARADEIDSARRLPADLARTLAEAGFSAWLCRVSMAGWSWHLRP